MRRFVSFAPSVIILTLTLATLVAVPMGIARAGHAAEQAQIRLAAQSLAADDILERIDRAQTAVADMVRPGVVHIESRRGFNRRGGGGSSGTGWIYDDEGHIVTNAHVIKGAERIQVQFANGRTAEAERVSDDAFTDIAVLKVSTGVGVSPLSRATDETVRQGQQVFAFGSPFGFKFSMSKGLVSGLGRNPAGAIVSPSGFTNFIQTDAAVNPGNSGGPLVDTRGRVIGMNVAIATGRNSDGTTPEDGQSAGISFAIPVNVIESVVDQLIEEGFVRRGFLGITMPRSSRAVSEQITLETGYWGRGVPIVEVTSGSAADTAGVRQNDIITAFNGNPTPDSAILRSLISSAGPERPIDLTVFREGEFVDLHVVLDEFPVQQLAEGLLESTLGESGLAIMPVDDVVLVTDVGRGSRAERAGIREGFHISEIGGIRVDSYDAFVEQLNRSGWFTGQSVEFRLVDPRGRLEPYTAELRAPR